MKKVFLFLLLIIIPFMTYALPAGDVDGNGKVDTKDYLKIRKHLLRMPELTGSEKVRADVNGDGIISQKDYNLIRKIQLGLITVTAKPEVTPKTVVTAKPAVTSQPTSTPTQGSTSNTPIMDKFVIPKGYSDANNSYSSSTLKYKFIKQTNTSNYYALVWVKDAYHQLNSANSNYSNNERYYHLSGEVRNQNYDSKGMIAVNGSFTIGGRSNTPVIRTKGNSFNNTSYNSAYVYATLTLGSDNILKAGVYTNASSAKTWLDSVGARNTWAVTFLKTGDWTGGKDGSSEYRTMVCQINENNFVLYAGNTDGAFNTAKELHDVFGCISVANMDGGGSTGMYYKKPNNSIKTVTEIHRSGECCSSSCNNKCRKIADMLYFVEQ